MKPTLYNRWFWQNISSTIFSILVLLFFGSTSQAQMKIHPPQTIECPLPKKGHATKHLHTKKSIHLAKRQVEMILTPTASFDVTFSVGFDERPGAQEAVQLALDIWAHQIVSSVPIKINLGFSAISGAGRASTGFVSNFPNSPQTEVIYPIALADAIAQQDLRPDTNDISIIFSESENWYYGTDGNPGEFQVDLLTIALHEIGHGLGFLGGIAYDRETGEGSIRDQSNQYVIYENFLVDSEGNSLLELSDPSIALGDAATGNNLFMGGTSTIEAGNGQLPKLYAPSNYRGGSSTNHWDEIEYPSGTVNSVMTPFISPGASNFNVGPLTRGLFRDMGWRINPSSIFNLSANVTTLVDTLQVNANNNLRSILLTNSSDIEMVLNASTTTDGVSLITEDIIIPPGESTALQLEIRNENFGFYFGEIFLTNNNFPVYSIPYELIVLDGSEKPEITFSRNLAPSEPAILEQRVESSDIYSLRIENEGRLSLEYALSIDDGGLGFISTDNQLEGTINPEFLDNNSELLIFTINTKNLKQGETYPFEIRVTSNDPEKRIIAIQKSLQVIAQLDVSILEERLILNFDFNETPGSTIDVPFTIQNNEDSEIPLRSRLFDEAGIAQTTLINAIKSANPGVNNFTIPLDITGIPVGTYNWKFIVEELLFGDDANPLILEIPVTIAVSSSDRSVDVSTDFIRTSLSVAEAGVFIKEELIDLKNITAGDADFLLTTDTPEYISFDPARGVIAADSTVNVTVSLDATNLANGNYESAIRINDNINIPIFFNVENQVDGRLELSFALTSYLAAVGEIEEGPLISLKNAGMGSVQIDSLYFKNSEEIINVDYEIRDENFEILHADTIPSGGQVIIFADFAPQHPGEFAHTLVIESKDLIRPFIYDEFRATATLEEPVLSATSDRIKLFKTETDTIEFTLENTSAISLSYEVVLKDSTGTIYNQPIERQDINAGEIATISSQLHAENFKVGTHPLTATVSVFFEDEEQFKLTESITVEVLAPAVTGFALLDYFSREVITTVKDGDTLDVSGLGPVVGQAFTHGLDSGSVVFDYNGNRNSFTDHEFPYILELRLRNFNAFGFPLQIPLGTNTITATPFCETDNSVDPGTPLSIVFYAFNSNAPGIAGFELIDAESDTALHPLNDGDVIYLGDYNTRLFDIRAIGDGKAISFMKFNYDNGEKINSDIRPPYALGANLGNNYIGFPLTVDQHTVRAQPYGRDDTSGPGNPSTILFEVREGSSEDTAKTSLNSDPADLPLQIYPNPAKERITILTRVQAAKASLEILNNLGQVVYQYTFKKTELGSGTLNKEIFVEDLQAGFYHIKVSSGTQTITGKFLIIR